MHQAERANSVLVDQNESLEKLRTQHLGTIVILPYVSYVNVNICMYNVAYERNETLSEIH